MKTFVFSISVLLIMIILVLMAMSFLHNNIEFFLSLLDKTRQQYFNNDVNAAKETLKNLTEKYDKLRPVFSVLINHNEISKVEISLLKIKSYLENNELALFEAEYQSLVFVLKNIYSSEILNLANLF